MKLILSHPTGNANVRQAACGLLAANLLGEFHTSIASFPNNILDRISIGPLSEIRRRRFDSALEPFTRTWPWVEAGRLVASKVGFNKLTVHEKGSFCIDSVYKSLDKRVASRLKHAIKFDAVYSYEDGAAITFREAKRQNLLRFYDLPIGYWRTARQLLEKEKEQWPDWAATITGFNDSEEKLSRKDEELQLADRIFVASQFTANTLKQFPGALPGIEVIPYGFPKVVENRLYAKVAGRPLKLLFVGGLSQRKGIANLFAAVETFGNHVELTVVGHKPVNSCYALDAALGRHRWIHSLPHAEILKIMQAHDVLVFPSLFEGFGLVITEAMSQGTPVITTDRTAGPDLIRHGQNGWLAEAGSTQALKAAIEDILLNSGMIATAGREAMETARKRPWEAYGKELAEAIMRYNHLRSGA